MQKYNRAQIEITMPNIISLRNKSRYNGKNYIIAQT